MNQLNQADKGYSNEGAESQDIKEDAPEIITARPDDAFITVMVAPEDNVNQTRNEGTAGESSVESIDFGDKTTTPETPLSSTEGNANESAPEIPHTRKVSF